MDKERTPRRGRLLTLSIWIRRPGCLSALVHLIDARCVFIFVIINKKTQSNSDFHSVQLCVLASGLSNNVICPVLLPSFTGISMNAPSFGGSVQVVMRGRSFYSLFILYSHFRECQGISEKLVMCGQTNGRSDFLFSIHRSSEKSIDISIIPPAPSFVFLDI